MNMTFKKSHLLSLVAGAALFALPTSAAASGFIAQSSGSNALIGALAGGILGSNLASPGVRTEGAALGAVVGGLAGSTIGSNRSYSSGYGYGYRPTYVGHSYPSYSYTRPVYSTYTSRPYYNTSYGYNAPYYGGSSGLSISIGNSYPRYGSSLFGTNYGYRTRRNRGYVRGYDRGYTNGYISGSSYGSSHYHSNDCGH